MSGSIPKLYLATILFSSLSIFGCSSSDDGGGTAVPTGAITIIEANAKQVLTDAIDGGTSLLDAVDFATAIDVDQDPSAMDIIDLAMDKAKNMDATSALSTPTGVVFSDTCTGGGTFSGDVTETLTSLSGTVTFTNCIELGITLNGSITFNFTENLTTGDYTDSLSGNLSGTDSIDTLILSGLSFNETGNNISGAFSLNTYTFSADDTAGGGFLVQLLAAIVGNDQVTCPSSGIVLVTGANNTQAKATINANTVTVEFNDGSGTFTEVTGSPFPCTDFFI